MSSILNSISSGDLQVQEVPREIPVKEDSIIDLLQNVEIEFEPCPKVENPQPEVLLQNLEIEFEIHPELEDQKQEKENIEIEFENCPKLEESTDDFNTGFGENKDLYYETKCPIPKLEVPLYKDNYLGEFKTEEEKAAARHALGLYNKEDIVAMSMLTAEDKLPTKNDLIEAAILQLRKGDKFFTPITSFNAVFDLSGNTLTTRMQEINVLIAQQQQAINKINQVSNQSTITSLGDVKVFLQGFNNGDNLHSTLDDMNKEMLRFEKTGQMN